MTFDDACRICYPDFAIPDTTPIVRGAVEELLLTLDRGLSQIEMAGTLEEAQKTAAGIREALREGWPS